MMFPRYLRSLTLRGCTLGLGSALALLVLVCLPAPVVAQDPGSPDTLQFVGDELVVGQSRPIGVRFCNDSTASSFSLVLSWESGPTGGFAAFDSLVYRGRMVDPSIFTVRLLNSTLQHGDSPDTLLLGFYNLAGATLPPGDDILFDLYFTGTSEGTAVFDTGQGPTIHGASCTSGSFKEYEPVVVALEVPVVVHALPPGITLPEEITPILTGVESSFEVMGDSPEGWPVVESLVSLVDFDDSTRTPSGTYSMTGSNPATFAWTPAVSDMGIWRATFAVCDSSGVCVGVDVVLQVVTDDIYRPAFATTTNVVVDKGFGLTSGDFLGDSRPELYLYGIGSINGGSDMIYTVGAQGELTEVYAYFDPNGSSGVRAGYMDSDDQLDVVSRRRDSVDVMLGDGNGDFVRNPFHTSILFAKGAALGEFNGDANLDYVCGGSLRCEFFYGLGDGTVEAGPLLPVADTVMSVDGADFDGDGDRDLAVGTRLGLSIYLNNGSGAFSAGANYAQTFGTADVQITSGGSDFNNDGVYDLSLASPSLGGTRGDIVLYFGNGDATFEQSLIRSVLGQVVATFPGDFNNDTYLDIAFANAGQRYVGILFGDGTGAFENEVRFPVGSLPPRGMACTDFDGDGDLDIFVNCSYSAHVALDTGIIVSLVNTTDPPGFVSKSIEIEGDNNVELTLASENGYEVSELKSTYASGRFFQRRFDEGDVIDQQLAVRSIAAQPHVIHARPKAGAVMSEPFSLAMTIDGARYRLADRAPMNAGGYDFPIAPAGQSAVLPRSGSFVRVARPTFTWQAAGSMIFEVSDDITFDSVLYSETVSGTSLTLPIELSSGDTTLFYWRLTPLGEAPGPVRYAINIVGSAGVVSGDLTGDGLVNLSDVTALVNWLFLGSPPPPNAVAGDVNASGGVNLTDLTYLVNYLFLGGPAPL